MPPPARASCHSTARLLLPACHPPPLPILKDCAGSMDAGRCPGDCCGNGLCLDGVCECQDGFGPRLLEDSSSGVNDCCQRVCPDDCGSAAGHGLCDAQVGRCVCAVGWSGASCDEPACPRAARHTGCATPRLGNVLVTLAGLERTAVGGCARMDVVPTGYAKPGSAGASMASPDRAAN